MEPVIRTESEELKGMCFGTGGSGGGPLALASLGCLLIIGLAGGGSLGASLGDTLGDSLGLSLAASTLEIAAAIFPSVLGCLIFSGEVCIGSLGTC